MSNSQPWDEEALAVPTAANNEEGDQTPWDEEAPAMPTVASSKEEEETPEPLRSKQETEEEEVEEEIVQDVVVTDEELAFADDETLESVAPAPTDDQIAEVEAAEPQINETRVEEERNVDVSKDIDVAAATSFCDSGITETEIDLEASIAEEDGDKLEKKMKKRGILFESPVTSCSLAFNYLLLFALAVFLPAWLLSHTDKSSGPTVQPPTKAPSGENTMVSPTTAPGTQYISKDPIPTPIPSSVDPGTTDPAAAPPVKLFEWSQSYDTFSGAGKGFGCSVAFDDSALVVGEPSRGTGQVRSFFVNDMGETEFNRSVAGEQDGSGFGWSVDLQNSIMAVGAPYLRANRTTEVGGAYVYQFNDELRDWVLLGSSIREDIDKAAIGGDFGASVAVSHRDNIPRVSVGAPMNNLGTGRVYLYELEGNESAAWWIAIEGLAIVGDRAGDEFGSSLDMSKDGMTIIAGAPGNSANDEPGYVRVYRDLGTTDTAWDVAFFAAGEEPNEEFGASVAMLSDKGNAFAIGAPAFKNGSGRVQVFRKGEDGLYHQVGADIVGREGERVGATRSLSGSGIGEELSVVVATANGEVKRYDLDTASNTWKALYETLDSGFSGGVFSLSTSGENSEFLVVGGALDNSAVIFGTAAVKSDESISTPEPSADTAAPTLGIVSDRTELPTKTPTTEPVSTAVTVAPTTAPTTALTQEPSSEVRSGWEVVGGPFTVFLSNSGFGSSVALSDAVMIVGAPNALLGTGAVFSYTPDNDGLWIASQAQYGEQSNTAFGHDVDLDGTSMLIGAPRQYAPDTTMPVGAAFFYEFDNGDFTRIGNPMYGASGDSVNEELFGSSVAVSKNRIAAVGAPGNSDDSRQLLGAIYIFEYDNDSSDWILQHQGAGFLANDRLGDAVDIDTENGKLVIAGAPGNDDGFALIYEKFGDAWINTFLEFGSELGEAFGKSVKVLSPTLVAIGAPSYMDGNGRIVVLEKIGISFERLPDLVGQPNDRLGEARKLAGYGTTLVVGTNDGRVQRFLLDRGSQSWILIGEEVVTTFGSNLQSIATSNSSERFASGGNMQSSVYEHF